MQNEIYPDESAEESAHREHIFERIKNGQIHPAGRVREQHTTFSIFEGDAKWLMNLVDKPIYEDEDEDEEVFRKAIKEEFWCPDIMALEEARRYWDHIPF